MVNIKIIVHNQKFNLIWVPKYLKWSWLFSLMRNTSSHWVKRVIFVCLAACLQLIRAEHTPKSVDDVMTMQTRFGAYYEKITSFIYNVKLS